MDARLTKTVGRIALLIGLGLAPGAATGAEVWAGSPAVPSGTPEASVDLATTEGVRLLKGEWRYSDTKLVEVDFKAAGADGQPTGGPNRTYDFTPHAGAADFDDSGWEVIDPVSLSKRRSTGRLCFNWYRTSLTVPDKVGSFDPTGSTIVFETSLDDYAEVWVDGEIGRALGQSGGSMVKGWNAPNRLVVARDARPGQKVQLAVFGINGPLSNPPTNYIWMRLARLEFHRTAVSGPIAVAPHEVNVEVIRNDPAIDAIVPPNPKVFKLAEGFLFTEGPVWSREGGHLLFSDPNRNTIYKYTPEGQLSVFRERSGYEGADIAEYTQPGSNGLTFDKDGRLTVLADRYRGRRLNSPNDLVYRSDGTLYFTDPPFGLPRAFEDRRKELPFSGVYSVTNGKVRLLSDELTGPNGIAFSPDEKTLYVGNWDERRKVVMSYEVRRDGSLGPGRVFFDMTSAKGEDAIDGIKVDEKGNVYVSGPGGLWILSPGGKHLGTIVPPKHPHNFAWGDADGKTLYLCARNGLYRIRLNVAGVRP